MANARGNLKGFTKNKGTNHAMTQKDSAKTKASGASSRVRHINFPTTKVLSFFHNMENREYQAILNYITRREYPVGFTKEQKRALRRKVAVRNGNENSVDCLKFVAKDGVLYFVDDRPDD